MMLLRILAWLTALAWMWKAVTAARGLRRIPNLLDPQYSRTPTRNPSIAVIVPARNEQDAVRACLESLLNQDYSNLRIIAINDRSTDATGTIMDDVAARDQERLRALYIRELPAGWLGKTHAMAMAARHAIAINHPDYLFFTDADVLFQPDALRRSLAEAVATDADHFVCLPTPIIKSPGEGMLLGYLSVMSLWPTRPWLVADPAKRDSIGIGAFNLLRTSAYQKLGGFDSLRMEILEDLTLARRVKQAGLRQRVAVAPGMVSVHWAPGAAGVVRVMTKNLFALCDFRVWAVFLAALLLTIFCVGPVVWLMSSATRTPAALSLAAIAALYIASKRHSRIPAWYALSFPVGAALFLFSLLRSAFATLEDRGVTWRGTFYSLDELRKGRMLWHK